MRFADPQKIIQQFGIVEGMKIADLGSGAGFFSIPLAKRVGEGGMVYAVDLRDEVLSRLKKTAGDEHSLENLEIIKADIEKQNGTTLEDASVDAALVVNTLFASSKKSEFAKEAKRVLTSRGKLLVVDWSTSLSGMGPSEDELVSRQEAKEIFEDAGFSYVRDVEAGEYHYGMVFSIV